MLRLELLESGLGEGREEGVDVILVDLDPMFATDEVTGSSTGTNQVAGRG